VIEVTVPPISASIVGCTDPVFTHLHVSVNILGRQSHHRLEYLRPATILINSSSLV
jgi:hypothetical protein